MQAQSDQQLHWQPLPLTEYPKSNIDGAVFAQENKVSIGACLRDKSGSFVVVHSLGITADKPNRSEYDSLIVNCRTVLSRYPDFVVVFARCQANGSAHAPAKAALSHASRITFDDIPYCIATIILNEMR
ncbi:hypothetical protein L195_g055138 [Trifolium pratense]|uniref:RNase H type-1 domain-containing protein n=1 Tax=Trifolium pratense TaxID=57577 RepID=A0A2K3KJR8_TRIPR|nr:hypothetical protein L195_g055138 [Trifolium pratense]